MFELLVQDHVSARSKRFRRLFRPFEAFFPFWPRENCSFKKRKKRQTCGKPYGNACHAGYHTNCVTAPIHFLIF